jgi:hypothetical protein
MTTRRTIVRYTVRPGLEEHNAQLVRAVYRELAELAPPGFRYATYRLHDGRTFVHVAEQEHDSPGPLAALAAFRAFQREIGDRCEWGPVAGSAEVIGRFGD